MKAIVVMFDSLNRHFLPPYGCDWVHAPNFTRLAGRTVCFDRSYVGSMPCIPARRDMHTGRLNFFHRSWGPLEPFDDSVPQMLRENGIWTHLSTDHGHYFEDGGTNYHTRFSTWEFARGQEGDPWIGLVYPPDAPENAVGRNAKEDPLQMQDLRNRSRLRTEADLPMTKTFQAGLDFIRRNRDADNWFLQIETFDPHEPFFSLPEHKRHYAAHYGNYDGPFFDWPAYRPVDESPQAIEHLRHEYASLVSHCDKRLGEFLDLMDAENLWEDTLLIVMTDHGFMLAEHAVWAKVWCPFYEEVAHTPFFVWDPRCGRKGERCDALVQPSLEVPVTLLNYFGLRPTSDMTGVDLAPVVAGTGPGRDFAVFGVHGLQVNVTDGDHVLWLGPPATEPCPAYEYTLLPMNMKHAFPTGVLRGNIQLQPPFRHTKGCSLMKIRKEPFPEGFNLKDIQTRLYDLRRDPSQQNPIHDDVVEQRLKSAIRREMERHDAPSELYSRLGL